MEKSRGVVLDLAAVQMVGQGFADEVVRVRARAHPGTRQVLVGMSQPVAYVVERAIRSAATTH